MSEATHVGSGKVRELYALDEERLLLVASDRISTFDVILPTEIPDKGRVLTGVSGFWFARTSDLVPNHLIALRDDGRSTECRKLAMLPIECVVRAAAVVGMENVPLWHERDISHSSAERVVIPDAFLAVDYVLDRFTWIMDDLVVYPERMERNLWASHGLFFSHRLLLALIENGQDRAESYRLVQRNAMRAWDEERDFAELVRADAEITAHLDEAALADVFDLNATIAHLDTTFDRVRRLVPKEEPVHV